MLKKISSIVLVSCALSTGCASVTEYQYLYTNKFRAWNAWREAKPHIPSDKVTRDFAKGYRAGYLDVSQGGNGALPPVAPNEYWQPSHSSGHGRCAVTQWYEGFSVGAADALRQCKNHEYDVPSCYQTTDAHAIIGQPCGLENNQYRQASDLSQNIHLNAVPHLPTVPILEPHVPLETQSPIASPSDQAEIIAPHDRALLPTLPEQLGESVPATTPLASPPE